MLRIATVFALVIAYIVLFLESSISKYLRKGLLVVETWEDVGEKIKPPLLVLIPIDGWKTLERDQTCVNKSGEELKLCIEENTFSIDEVLVHNTFKHKRKITFSPQV